MNSGPPPVGRGVPNGCATGPGTADDGAAMDHSDRTCPGTPRRSGLAGRHVGDIGRVQPPADADRQALPGECAGQVEHAECPAGCHRRAIGPEADGHGPALHGIAGPDWCGRSARSRTQDPFRGLPRCHGPLTFSRSRPFFGCLCGPLSFAGETIPGSLPDPPRSRRRSPSPAAGGTRGLRPLGAEPVRRTGSGTPPLQARSRGRSDRRRIRARCFRISSPGVISETALRSRSPLAFPQQRWRSKPRSPAPSAA